MSIANLIEQFSSGKDSLLEGLYFWEKRRLAYNICVGVSGVLSMIFFNTPLDLLTAIGIVMYGILANVCYSAGFCAEAFFLYHFKKRFPFASQRQLFFVFGTGFAMLVTLGAMFLFTFPIQD